MTTDPRDFDWPLPRSVIDPSDLVWLVPASTLLLLVCIVFMSRPVVQMVLFDF